MNFKTLKRIFDSKVNKIKKIPMTDEYRGCSSMAGNGVVHMVINHQREYVNGDVFTNTIEGFWSLIKRAWYGSHHHYSRENIHLYGAETSYVYNNRKNDNVFMDTIKRVIG